MPEFFRSTAKKPGATKVRKGYKKGGLDSRCNSKATGAFTKKPCTAAGMFVSETCPPGSKRYNLAKTFRSDASTRTKADKGLLQKH